MPIRLLLLVSLFLSFQSCKQKPRLLSRTGLIKYIADKKNNLSLAKEINGIQVQVSFQPSSVMVNQELQSAKIQDTQLIRTLTEKYGKNYYFLLKYSKNNKEVIRQLGGFSKYSEMLHVFAFQVPEFVHATVSKSDTVSLRDFLFEQSYGMTDGNSILLVFDKAAVTNSNKNEFNIHVNECGLNIGNLVFSFKISDLENIPSLDYSKPD